MCDKDHFAESVAEYEARGLVTRRQFGVLLAAVLILMVLAALIYRFWGFIARGPRAMARAR